MYPKSFNQLIESFQRLPGVGKKTAERYAYTVLNWDEETRNHFIETINHMNDIKRCKICGNICEGDSCEYCKDKSRDHSTICVVESPKDISSIESMNEYHGVYHVLNGMINPKKGILPDQLNIDSLVERMDGDIREVILALSPTIDGETTSLYLEKLLKDKVLITRLAYGIPIGAHLDYTDSLTLLKAFEGRK